MYCISFVVSVHNPLSWLRRALDHLKSKSTRNNLSGKFSQFFWETSFEIKSVQHNQASRVRVDELNLKTKARESRLSRVQIYL